MAFTVEDGTGVANANSYASVAYADDYFADRGNAAWAALADDAAKEVLLVRATDYIETAYARRFAGEMKDYTQALSWPRVDTDEYLDVDYADVIPDILQKAACEYALIAKDGPLMPVPQVDDTGLPVVITRKAVGPIEKEFRLAGTKSTPDAFRSYPFPDSLVAKLLVPSGRGVIR